MMEFPPEPDAQLSAHTAPTPPRSESLTVEFKSDRKCLPDHELIEALVCLANSQGGELCLVASLLKLPVVLPRLTNFFGGTTGVNPCLPGSAQVSSPSQALVHHQVDPPCRWPRGFQQRRSLWPVSVLARREAKAHRRPVIRGKPLNPGVPSSSGLADGVEGRFFERTADVRVNRHLRIHPKQPTAWQYECPQRPMCGAHALPLSC